jgi:hypothetical protein
MQDRNIGHYLNREDFFQAPGRGYESNVSGEGARVALDGLDDRYPIVKLISLFFLLSSSIHRTPTPTRAACTAAQAPGLLLPGWIVVLTRALAVWPGGR